MVLDIVPITQLVILDIVPYEIDKTKLGVKIKSPQPVPSKKCPIFYLSKLCPQWLSLKYVHLKSVHLR